MILTATIRDEDGKAIAVLVMKAKMFKTGSTGFQGVGKIEWDGTRYQGDVQMVAIGSKLKANAEEISSASLDTIGARNAA